MQNPYVKYLEVFGFCFAFIKTFELAVKGHVQLHRTTASEREERKKKEKDWKRLRNEDDFSSGTTVKYSLGLHHQVRFLFQMHMI